MISISKLYCGLSAESDWLRYSAPESVGPVVVYNCTSRCNLKCLHCYNVSDSDHRPDELTTPQAKQLLVQLKQADCPAVLFSGGEPLLRRDLFELLAYARRLNLKTVISTNGTLIDSSVADKLAALDVAYVGISLDGEEKFHDEFRQTPGSFRLALAGIESCKKAGLKTGLRFTITKANIEQIPFIFDIAVSMQVPRICFYHLIRTGRAKMLNNYAPTHEQTRHAVETIIDKTRLFAKSGGINEVLTVDNHCDGPYLLMKMIKEANQCYKSAERLLFANGGNKVGEKIASVGCDGNVYPDQFWHNYSLGNVKDKTFSEIWGNPDEPVLNKLRSKQLFADKRCLKCRWFGLCRGNFRFLDDTGDSQNWINEPPCYLTDSQIMTSASELITEKGVL